MRFIIISLMTLLLFYPSIGQNKSFFQEKIDSIRSILKYVNNLDNDSMKLVLGERSANFLQDLLMHPKGWRINYSSLSDVISYLETDDKIVRIFTWGIKLSDDYIYYGFIYRYDKKSNSAFFYRLYDKSDKLINSQKKFLDAWNWYGCVYYKVITKKYKGKTIYTVLGTDPNGNLLNRKIIDVITFYNNGSPRFGYNFKDEIGQPVKRFIFEYNNQAAMLLKWDDILNMIIFDHLSPSEPKYKGMHQFYGPDFSYDGLKFEKGKWLYVIDLDVRAPKE